MNGELPFTGYCSRFSLNRMISRRSRFVGRRFGRGWAADSDFSCAARRSRSLILA
ncbi:MAG: hypothetical protein U5P41_13480 [Gammaproteobacteria bacterium]|nr:hypothetical protein [Gammaproteobacteria bacterium]